ncbi:MAG: hypothetical protein DMF61_01425 [Blastocatellia bacterium AA13]|nr:MAG: hypothetical protein DMF61_01425 [Blastocatellia bacterium AA13]
MYLHEPRLLTEEMPEQKSSRVIQEPRTSVTEHTTRGFEASFSRLELDPISPESRDQNRNK